MADLAQLVRALVCGTRGRGFEPHLPPLQEKDNYYESFSFFYLSPFAIFVESKKVFAMNIVSSFTDRSASMIRGFAYLIIGLVLVLWPDVVSRTIVYVIGAIFTVAGIFDFVAHLRKTSGRSFPFSVAGLGGLLFGIVLLIFPDFFLNLLMYLFALAIIIAGTGAVGNMYYTSRFVPVPFWMYVVPALIICSGVLILFNPFKTLSSIFVFSGVVMAIYALSEIFGAWKYRNVEVFDSYGRKHIVEDTDFEEDKGI